MEQNHDWEQAVKHFCRRLYGDSAFRAALEPFVERLAPAGERAALAQLALKLTVPGVPDLYQGDELPFRALVDPDNRRPIDWGWHQAMLRRLLGGSPPTAETRKLFVTMRLLGLRVRRPELFASGSYEPLDAGEHGCAFLRGGELLVVSSMRERAEGELHGAPTGRWRDLFRGEERSFSEREGLGRLVGGGGVGVFERVG